MTATKTSFDLRRGSFKCERQDGHSELRYGWKIAFEDSSPLKRGCRTMTKLTKVRLNVVYQEGHDSQTSNLPRIVGPMQERLSLSPPAIYCATRTVLLELRDMALHRAPAFDLALIVGTSASQVVAAVPLEPSARIFVINPTLPAPDRKRL